MLTGSSLTVSGDTLIKSAASVTDTGLTTGRLSIDSAQNLTLTAGTTNVTSRLMGLGSVSGAGTLSLGSGAVHTAGGVLSGVGGTATSTIATQSISNLTYSSASVFEWDFSGNAQGTRGTQYDAVNVSGTLNVASDSIFRIVLAGVDFTNGFWMENRTWSDIFNVGTLVGGFTTPNLQVVGAPGNLVDYGSFSISGTTLTWSSVVPEPTSALAGLLIVGGLLRRRR